VSDAAATNERTQRFAEAVRNFAGVPPKRFAALLPHREGIAELRQKGASFGMIRELLAMAGIEVAADTVRRFFREMIEERRTGANDQSHLPR
jgi:ERCC4-type nuclease